MIRATPHHDLNPGWMLVLSLVLHLAIIFMATRARWFTAELHEIPAQYVDIISLPVDAPAPGAPQATSEPPLTAPSRPTVPPPPAATPAMSLPLKSSPSSPTQKPSPAHPSPDDSASQEAREFDERLRRLERSSEARHQAAALESLQKKAAARAGGPTGTGTVPGYDYASYIQSRLKDALATTMVYRSRQPETAVHLYIDKKGKLLRYVMVKPSSDKLFNDSIIRTIEKAKATFPPPPSGADFDKLYVFSPQEVNTK